MPAKKNVGVVIVNWNNYEDSKEALESIREQTYPKLKVVVVDGNSSDNSTRRLKREFSENKYLFLKKNRGYAYSVNAGIKYLLEIGVDNIVLMNNDVILDPRCIELLVTNMNQQLTTCSLGPRIFSYYDRDKFQLSGSSVSLIKAGPISNWSKINRDTEESSKPYIVKKLPGSCFMVTREIVEKTGFMDDNFFLYYSDTDWQKRFDDLGICQKVIPTAKTFHKISSTTGRIENRIFYYDTRDLLNYVKKHHSVFLLLYVFARQYLEKFIKALLSNKAREKLKYLNLAYWHFLKNRSGRVL